MDVCERLKSGFSLGCDYLLDEVAQKIVLVNKDDVKNYAFLNDNRIRFKLKDGKSGFLFSYQENSKIISARASKKEISKKPFYTHEIEIYIVGTDKETTKLLNELDLSNYFGAVLYSSNVVKIFGFNYGLKTDNYTYSVDADLRLVSREDERDLPYFYNSISSNEVQEFEDLFLNNADIEQGDFNIDFNTDFYNGL